MNFPLLNAHRVVSRAELRAPAAAEALRVVKNGGATGTTVGRLNGLESFVRMYPEVPAYGNPSAAGPSQSQSETHVALAVLPHSRERGAFSAPGDSGAIVLERSGGIVGMVTGGSCSGEDGDMDVTYVTPYWWLEEQIQKVVPGCCLYGVRGPLERSVF